MTATRYVIKKQGMKKRDEFRNISDVVKERWEAHERDIVEQQPGIRQRLIYAIQKYSNIPYYGLTNFIQPWCSA